MGVKSSYPWNYKYLLHVLEKPARNYTSMVAPDLSNTWLDTSKYRIYIENLICTSLTLNDTGAASLYDP